MRMGDMAVGSLMYLNVSGVQTAFRVMHHGKPSDEYDDSWVGGTAVMLDWSEEAPYRNMVGGSIGKKNYSSSDLHSWLNGTWLGYLDDEVAEQVVEVKLPYRTDTDKSPYEVATGDDGLAAKVWVPSAVEVARGSAYLTDQSTFYVTEGAVFDYWKGAAAAQYADWACLNEDGSDLGWATRTQNQNYTGTGSLFFNQVGQDGLCIAGAKQKVMARPCLVLPDELLVVGGNIGTAGNVPVKTDGIWRDGLVSTKINGVWNPAVAAMARVEGVWKE